MGRIFDSSIRPTGSFRELKQFLGVVVRDWALCRPESIVIDASSPPTPHPPPRWGFRIRVSQAALEGCPLCSVPESGSCACLGGGKIVVPMARALIDDMQQKSWAQSSPAPTNWSPGSVWFLEGVVWRVVIDKIRAPTTHNHPTANHVRLPAVSEAGPDPPGGHPSRALWLLSRRDWWAGRGFAGVPRWNSFSLCHTLTLALAPKPPPSIDPTRTLQAAVAAPVRRAPAAAIRSFHNGRVVRFHPSGCGCGCGSSPFAQATAGNQAARRWFGAAAEKSSAEQAEAAKAEEDAKEAEAQKEEAKQQAEQIVTLAKHQEAIKVKDAMIAEYKDRLVRQVAETENVRRRAEVERENATKFGTTKLAKSLLDVADTLEISIKAVQPYYEKIAEVAELDEGNKNFKSLYEGLELTHRVLMKAFENNEIRKFESLNKPFDPNFHDGAFQIDHPDLPAHTIGHVMKEGYTIYERVLRAAVVGTVRPRE